MPVTFFRTWRAAWVFVAGSVRNDSGEAGFTMKHASVSAEILGEKYRVSGEFETVNRMLALFRETLETVRGTTGAGEVSSHRLAVLTALALAEKLALAREREKRKSAVVAAIRREVACLVEHVGKDRS